METPEHLEQRISGIACLDQPLRRDLYRLLSERGRWTTRDEAAEALGIARSVAAFHLDKLEEAGLAEVSFQRLTGRRGPGAGRPAKLYRTSQDEVTASVPERHYDLAGSMLATAIAESEQSGAPVAQCLAAASREAGRAVGEEAVAGAGSLPDRAERRDAILEVLRSHGYEPVVDDQGDIALVNCPFHRLAEEHRALVCGMNLDFLTGVLDTVGPDEPFDARLQPEPGFCCVRIHAA